MEVQITLAPGASEPVYATDGSGCFDIFNYEEKSVDINPGHAAIFSTGMCVKVPDDHVMLIFSRSGHGFKTDVRLANCVGVIDSDYTGEVKVKLTNDNKRNTFTVWPGERIAQAMILPVQRVSFNVVAKLPETERGEGGFGSTGR